MSFIDTRDISLNEQQMFLLLRSFEQDMKSIISYFLSERIARKELFAHCLEKIEKRRNTERNIDTLDLDLLDISDLFEILFRYKPLLPNDILLDFNSLKNSQSELIRIRNRIMHSRPLYEDDDKNLLHFLGDLRSDAWKSLRQNSQNLSDSKILESIVISDSDESGILHNLPKAEHGETGLVGRQSDISQIKDWLSDDRISVVTITGSGGLGKTALALQIAYDLIDSKNCPFEAVLWVSLKKEKLTIEGIQEISEAVTDIPAAVSKIGEALDSSFRGAINDLAGVLSDSKVLICIDNLETVSGTDFMELYDSLKNVKFLLTSRNGVGQIERRYDLAPLSDKDGLHYLHLLIRKYRVNSLADISEESKKQIVTEFMNNPLSIKWFVLSIAAGKTIYEIKNKRKELINFCVQSVILALDVRSRSVLLALYVANKAVLFEDLLNLTQFDANDVSLGIQELSRNALIRTRMISTNFLREEVQLTEIATSFIKNSGGFLEEELKKFEKLHELQNFDESRRLEDLKVSRFQPFSIYLRNSEDKSVAAILRKSLKIQKINPKQALELIDVAKRTTPDYWEVYKVEGYVRHFLGEDALSLELYFKGLELAPNDEDKSIMFYFLAKKYLDMLELDRAQEMSLNALNLWQTHETLHQHGWIMIRQKRFSEGIRMIEPLLEQAPGDSRLIYITTLIGAYRRWADYCLEIEKNPDQSFIHLSKAFTILTTELDSGTTDSRFHEENARIIYQTGEILRVIHRYKSELDNQTIETAQKYYARLSEAFRNHRYGAKIKDQIVRFSTYSAEFHKMISAIIPDFELAQSNSSHENFAVTVYQGRIHSIIEGRYGFIENDSFPDNVFFSGAALLPGVKLNDLLKGQDIVFELEASITNDATRVKAKSVWFPEI